MPSPGAAPAPLRRSWNKLVWGGGAALAVLAIVIAGLFWWRGSAKAPAPKDQARILQPDKGQGPPGPVQEKTPPSTVPPSAAPKALGGEGAVYTWQGWLYYLPGVGQPSRKLAPGRGPALSPDGRLVAYLSDKGPAVLDLATGQVAVISSERAIRLPLAWSPQGDYLAFVLATERPEFRQHLYIMRADGSGQREIVSEKFICAPAWAADGQSLFYHDIVNLYQVGITGAILSKRPFTAIGGAADSLTSTDRFVPSPTDPNLAVFSQAVPGSPLFTRVFQEPGTALFAYQVKQGTRQRLTPDNMMATAPVWSRDGRYVYFCGFYDHEHRERERFRLYRVAPDGSGLTATGIRLENVDWAW